MNKSKYLKSLNGLSATVHHKNWVDNDALRKALRKQLEDQGVSFAENCEESDTAFSFSNSQIVYKEVRPAPLYTATVVTKSNKVVITPEDKQARPFTMNFTDIKLTEEGFETENTNVSII